MIDQIRLLVANVYLVRGEKNVLIDTSKPGDAGAILSALSKKGVQPHELDLILLTHGHGDHAGSAKELRERTGAPIAIHAGDLTMVRTAEVGSFVSLGMEGRMVRPFVNFTIPTFEPDIILEDEGDMAQYGLEATLLHTPGHSEGSLSLLFANGEAIIGDVLRGGMMGGRLFSGRPQYPYFLPNRANLPQLHASIKRLLATDAKTFYVGHGGPLTVPDVQRWFAAV